MLRNYRGQRVDTKEWVYGGSIIKFNDDGVITYYMPSNTERCTADHENETDNVLSITGKFYLVKNVCEYTGLKDKNGKEIYEGDIVNHFEESALVIWDGDRYRLKWLSESCCYREDLLYWAETKWVKVIGNIIDNRELIDNPELLQEVDR